MNTNCKVTITSQTAESKYDELVQFLIENLPNVRNFDRCLSVEVFLNREENKMIFDEEWASIEHHKKYIQYISENGVMGQLAGFLKAPPEIDYYEKLAV